MNMNLEVHILTAFPSMFSSVFSESILKRAQDKEIVKISLHDIRKWTTDKHKTIDAKPYGGGAGMVMMIEPIYKALKDIKSEIGKKKTLVLLTSAKGEVFTQKVAREFSKYEALVIICGRYEGIDERVKEYLADREISIGKYVLTGGELPAMIITDAVTRLLPGVLGNEESLEHESFNEDDYIEFPQYTRPAVFIADEGREMKVPVVLLSGNHKEIEDFRSGKVSD